MLFDDAMHGHAEAMTAFYADPLRSVMVLRVAADLEYVAARFIAQLGCDLGAEGDASDAPLVLGVSADFVDAAAFYREAEAQIAEALAPVREAYAAEDPELVLPDGVARDRAWPPQCSLEARFAEYLECIARGLGNWHETVVLAVRFETIDPERAVPSLSRLAGHLVGRGMKLVLFDDRKAPRLSAIRGLRTRLAMAPFHAREGDGQGRLARFLAAEDNRVLGLAVRERNVRELWGALVALRDRGAPIRPALVEAPFLSRTQFCAEVVRTIASDGSIDALAFHDLRALDRPEATLVELVERIAARRGPAAPCVALRPTTVRDPAEWATFVVELAAACARVETKFLLL
ncbi:MAG TPA: hypothetical protein VFG69_04805, partial [Nannocystaceae bacterium]|nr:hypothetical protein [Nannocystaceae bacterium]